MVLVGRNKHAVAVNDAHGNGGGGVDGIEVNGCGNSRRIQGNVGNNPLYALKSHQAVTIIKQRLSTHFKQKQNPIAFPHIVADHV